MCELDVEKYDAWLHEFYNLLMTLFRLQSNQSIDLLSNIYTICLLCRNLCDFILSDDDMKKTEISLIPMDLLWKHVTWNVNNAFTAG